jgi:hypothetical protein
MLRGKVANWKILVPAADDVIPVPSHPVQITLEIPMMEMNKMEEHQPDCRVTLAFQILWAGEVVVF